MLFLDLEKHRNDDAIEHADGRLGSAPQETGFQYSKIILAAPFNGRWHPR